MDAAHVLLLAAAEEERLKKREVVERRILREESRPLLMPEQSFRDNFRLSKNDFLMLCDDLVPLLKPSQRSTAVRPDIKILAALQMYASGGYQGNVGNHYLLSLSQTTVCQCLEEVTEALNSPQILRKYIRFPESQAEREAVSQRFMEKFGFPGVVGCIDGTHCAIIRPKDCEEAYFNRKHYFSINAMMICDADLRILYIDPSCGGQSHDSQVWNGSRVKQCMQQLHQEGTIYWLLGDSGYAQRPWMMTPILGAAAGSPEEHYTKKHCSTRNVVERCFGVLKTRFRCLLAHRTMHYAPVKAAKIINACVVLHNLINDAQITIDEVEMTRDRRRQPAQRNADDNDDDWIPNVNDDRPSLVDRLWRSQRRSSR